MSPVRRAAKLLPIAVLCVAVLAGCAQEAPVAERELPSDKGPFAAFGYRNLTPQPIPATEMPQTLLADFMACSGMGEKRQAAGWVRDWFAAVSRSDQCDEWALQALANPRMRSNLLYILDQSGNHSASESCRKSTLALFTRLEETQSLLQSWRTRFGVVCNAERKRKVAESREEAFKSQIGDLDQALDALKRR
jgi:hypothetical protein